MARILIDLPDTFPFDTTVDVTIGLINRGNHLANEALVSLLNEARVRFLARARERHPSLAAVQWINADLAVVYRSEARHGERLHIAVAAGDFSRYGCDFLYRVSGPDGREIARAKTAMLCFDYDRQTLVERPAALPDWLADAG